MVARPSLRSLGTVVSLSILLAGGGGCASLASTTGPRHPDTIWSTASKQQVYTGERVEFDFVLLDAFGKRKSPQGVADYAVVSIGEVNLTTEADIHGRFRFSHDFADAMPGDELVVTAAAYQQRGARDFIVVRGEWVRTDSAYDEPDKRVARDKIIMIVYDRAIGMTLTRPAHDLDPTTGVLKLKRFDGGTTSVFAQTTTRAGFVMEGPNPEGYYNLTYTPKGGELSSFGTTDVSFRIYDITGQPYETQATVDSP
ncbi:MAG: hypothetical protein ACYTHJ_22045 [Planctomycetota bacterium]|jgi:hypothetical protein